MLDEINANKQELFTLLDAEKEKKNLHLEKQEPNKSQKLIGLFALVLPVLTITASATSVQLLERTVPDFELNTFRTGTALLLCSLVVLYKREWPWIPRSEVAVVSLSSVLSFISSVCYYIAVSVLPLTSVESLQVTSCISSGIPMFAFFLKERITVKRLLFAALCICGVISVTQPDFLFRKQQPPPPVNESLPDTIMNLPTNINETINAAPEDQNKFNVPIVLLSYGLAVISGLGVSVNLLVFKKYPYLEYNITEVLFWSFATGTILSAVIIGIFERPVLPYNWMNCLLVTAHCLCFAAMWPLYLYACRYISGNTVNIIWSTKVVLFLVIQYTLLSSILPGKRNWIEVAGVILVLIGSTLGSVWELVKPE